MEGKERQKLFAWMLLLLFNLGLGIGSYGGYLILINAELLISISILQIFLVVAYWAIYPILLLTVLAVDYLTWKKGWQWMFKQKVN